LTGPLLSAGTWPALAAHATRWADTVRVDPEAQGTCVTGTQRRYGPASCIGGRAVHISQRGKGETVLLLHGNGSWGNEILSFCPEVSSIEWIAPDRPGFGQSDPPPKGAWDPVSGANWTEDLICRVAPEGVTLVAHSLSAGQALICAALRPDLIRSLVLLAPFCRPTPHRLMPLLRIASLPGIGIPVRNVAVPLIGRLFGLKLLSRLLKTQTVPSG
jgi:pimeloyl-ACP methyl ester carboxylesterase